MSTERHVNEISIGVDPGRGGTGDPTAIVVVEVDETDNGRPLYHVRSADRLRVDSYTQLLPIIQGLANAWDGTRHVLIDSTGVGDSLVDFVRYGLKNTRSGSTSSLWLDPILITPGDTESKDRRGYHVSKSHLVTPTQAALADLRIKFPPGLKALQDELRTFDGEQTTARYRTFKARSGKHDDLVLALCYCCWYGEQHGASHGPGIY